MLGINWQKLFVSLWAWNDLIFHDMYNEADILNIIDLSLLLFLHIKPPPPPKPPTHSPTNLSTIMLKKIYIVQPSAQVSALPS